MEQLTVSIVITSKDRKQELAKCLESCKNLSNVNEILVFDDGSSDNTFSFIKERFPFVNILRSEKSLGLINARTYCASLAKGNIIVSIDDDCVFVDENTVQEIVAYFNHPKIAVVTIPVIDVLKSDKITQQGYGNLNNIYICPEFRGCAHALRKDVFIELGGYYNALIRQEEEKEFSNRLYSQGYIIRLGNCSKPILHYHSVIRNKSQIAFYRARNKFIVNYIYTPTVFLYFELFKQIFMLFLFEVTNGFILSCLKGCLSAIKQIKYEKIARHPLSREKYFFMKNLRLNGKIKINL